MIIQGQRSVSWLEQLTKQADRIFADADAHKCLSSLKMLTTRLVSIELTWDILSKLGLAALHSKPGPVAP